MSKLPLDYRTTFLFDELELKARYQLVENEQKNDPCRALIESATIENLLTRADINRRVLFTVGSVHASFGIRKQIYNTGMLGRIIANLLRTFGFNPHK